VGKEGSKPRADDTQKPPLGKVITDVENLYINQALNKEKGEMGE